MPSIISHSVVGLAAASTYVTGKNVPVRLWIMSAICASLPDADVLAFKLGIPYEHFWGHRGFVHSLSFAVVTGVVFATIFLIRDRPTLVKWFAFCGYFFLVAASHGVLDAFTSGGLGVALLSPFDNERYFFPWTPIEVSPIGIRLFFSDWGLQVMKSEFIWIWIPAILIVFARKVISRFKNITENV